MVRLQAAVAKGPRGHLADRPDAEHNGGMIRSDRTHLTVGVLGLIACVAANVWVFRYGVLAGLVGLNLTKHVCVAVLCQAVGVNKGTSRPSRHRTTAHPAHRDLAGPHSRTRDAR